MDAAHRGAERVEALLQRVLGVAKQRGEGGVVGEGGGELRLAQLHLGCDEVLLRAVMEVALDPAALHLIGIDDDPPRLRQFLDGARGVFLVRLGATRPSRPKWPNHVPNVAAASRDGGSASTTSKTESQAMVRGALAR